MHYFFVYIATLVPLIVLDALWLLVIAKKFYVSQIGFLLGKTVSMVPVAVFYPLYALGILVFAVLPALSSGSWGEAIGRGALLGLVAYGAYDLTNHATVAGWPLAMTLVDMAWGITLTAVVSIIAYLVIHAYQ